MIRHTLSHRDFIRLFLANSDDEMVIAEAIQATYPVNTQAAAGQLRTRGFDATPDRLDYLAKHGQIPSPAGEGRRRQWSIEHIDAAAERLDEKREWTPGTFARFIDGIDAAQDIEAQRAAEVANPLISPSLLVKVVQPGAPGAGVAAIVEYRPMTDDERAELERRIAEAKS